MLLILLFICVASASQSSKCSDGSTFTREQAWTCIINVADTDNDRTISPAEIEAAEYNYIPTWKRWALKAIAVMVTGMRVSHIMLDCDSDGDGYISLADFSSEHGTQYCMPYMDPATKWTTTSPALCYMKTFCDGAAAQKGVKVY